MSSKIKLIAITKPLAEGINTAEELLAFCARVSNPKNQRNNKTAGKLLGYCAKQKHVSVFEMADLTMEITTSRGIAQQILRHRSFCFQEFSQRYAEVTEFVNYDARRQDVKNRQNSIDDMSRPVKFWFRTAQKSLHGLSLALYKTALKLGVAKEQARFLLPLSTKTTIYMKGSLRSWITYCTVRCEEATQLEHREIANECYKIMIKQFPAIQGFLEDQHDYLKKII